MCVYKCKCICFVGVPRERERERMGRRGHCRREDEEWRQAACLLCTAMLVALIIVLIVLYFAVWKPRDPQLQLPTMQLLSLKTVRSGPGSTASDALAAAVRVENVSLNLQVVLYNPNRGVFWVSERRMSLLQ